MIIKEAKQLLEDHSITLENYGGFRTVYFDRRQYIPTAIVTNEVRTGSSHWNRVTKEYVATTKKVTSFVAKNVRFTNDGTWIISDDETLIPTAKCDASCRVSTSAMHAVQTYERATALANRIASLPSKAQIAESLGLNECNVSCHSQAQRYTITLSFDQMEALLGQVAK